MSEYGTRLEESRFLKAVKSYLRWARNRAPDSHAWLGAAFGAATTLLLGTLRTRFVGFPLSPSAYVLNLTWVLKASVLRYGGIKFYRTKLS